MRDVRAAGTLVYRGALFLYPPAFRRDFGPDMVRDFTDASHEAWTAAGRTGLALLWHQVALDLLLTASRQWLRTGLPLLAVLSILPAIGAASAIARLLAHTATPLHVQPEHQETFTLMLLIASVLLIIAATIVFTLWFTRPLLYRRRS